MYKITRSSTKRTRSSAVSLSGSVNGNSISLSAREPSSFKKKKNKYITIFCEGCETEFNERVGKFKSTREFIEEHALVNERCRTHLSTCKNCDMYFYSKQDRKKHFNAKPECEDFFSS